MKGQPSGPPKGPFCQSCSMPLDAAEQFGTDERGFRVNDYCLYCYKDGKFTEPDITMQQMIDRCVDIMVKQRIMSEPEARTLMTETMPRLKRWRKS